MSSSFDKKKIITRYRIIAYAAVLLGMLIVGRVVYIGTVKHDYWMKVAAQKKVKNRPILPERGNILSSDGRLLSGNLPEYEVKIDFSVCRQFRDTMWHENFEKICEGLHRIFPKRNVESIREHLQKGYDKTSKSWPIVKGRVTFDEFTAVKQLPVFNQPAYRGGFNFTVFSTRKKPFGSLAARTIGDLVTWNGQPKNGLEQWFDSYLRGTPGMKSIHKVLNKNIAQVEKEPVNGSDIVTTIDVGMQDLSERALVEKLKEINGNVGVAIVMEVKTGDVKAMVNMTKCADGNYYEIKNDAVSDLLEPGSVFKPASLLVALDDGVVDTTYTVDTGCGVWDMYGAKMKDHNWARGGYQRISLPKCLEVSSNIGVSRIIDRFYSKNPEKFVQGLKRVGMGIDLGLPFKGAAKAQIREPQKNKRGQYTNWYGTTLPWMSIGYETQIPPIYTLAFYNAIANNGKMVAPRFVKCVMKDGEVQKEFPIVVLREKICSDKALKEMQAILFHVVDYGLGKRAKSQSFKSAGKTGTAQISKGKGGYKNGMMNYLVSFAGYFPADAPRYSCIVCIQKPGAPASGGLQSGPVFRQISEGIMAQSLKLLASDARDSLSVFMPDVKNGNLLAADYVLTHLGVKTNDGWNGSYVDGNPIWGRIERNGNSVTLIKMPVCGKGIMPDVTGMGARDAVYVLEARGLKVTVLGRGKVREQSVVAGNNIRKGQKCVLHLR